MNIEDGISFYIPARNCARTLVACVDAVLAQTVLPGELFILVDPRSTDDTVAAAASTHMPVIEQTGATLGSARNQAIAAARHRWVASCDADVIIEPDWLEHLAARRGEGVAGIAGRTDEQPRTPFDEWRAINMPHHWGDHPLRNPFMLVSEVLFDRRALLAVGGYRDDLNYHEDSDLCQRLRDAGYDLFYEPAAKGLHHRSDTLVSLLTLRWKYSEYRQRALLDRYAGLIRKIEVNREYALTTLARVIARGKPELGYISFLLFFHHLLADLQSLLSHRPMTPPEVRLGCGHEVMQVSLDVLAEHLPDLAAFLRSDLERMQPGSRHHGNGHANGHKGNGKAAPDAIDHEANGGGTDHVVPPVWSGHLDEVRAGVERFCRELQGGVADIVAASAGFIHGRAERNEVPRIPPPNGNLSKDLEAMPLSSFVDNDLIASIRRQWPDSQDIVPLGPLAPPEKTALGRTFRFHKRQGQVALAAHLEARSDPLSLFGEINTDVHHLVACYQPPARFLPGLDVLSAGDLASAAASAGWRIDRFDTLVGRTRLMLSRNGGHSHS